MLSRNFRLQTVGNLDWLRENYDFDAITQSIDELVVLDVTRGRRNLAAFAEHLRELSSNYFLPISAGGGICSLEDGYNLLQANADKLIINSALIDNPHLVSTFSKTFGSQCVVASIDCRKVIDNYKVFIQNGSIDSGLDILKIVKLASELGVGEFYLTSMDRDGSGFGYDIDLVKKFAAITELPITVSGGVGRYKHFYEGLEVDGVTGASTANIYNFMVGGLSLARSSIVEQGIPMASWDLDINLLRGCCANRNKS